MLFLSTATNKVDKKGRVSVPAPFRAALANQSFAGIVAYISLVHPCVEACSMDRMQALFETIDQLDPFSDERDAFATTVLGGSVQLPFDGDGRVVLPASLMQSAGIEDEAVFVGKGNTFEIWNPKRFEIHVTNAREIAMRARHVLRASPQEKNASEKSDGGQKK